MYMKKSVFRMKRYRSCFCFLMQRCRYLLLLSTCLLQSKQLADQTFYGILFLIVNSCVGRCY